MLSITNQQLQSNKSCADMHLISMCMILKLRRNKELWMIGTAMKYSVTNTNILFHNYFRIQYGFYIYGSVISSNMHSMHNMHDPYIYIRRYIYVDIYSMYKYVFYKNSSCNKKKSSLVLGHISPHSPSLLKLLPMRLV